MPTPPPFPAPPERLLGRRFVSDDRRLALVLRRAADDAGFPLRVVVTRGAAGELALPARWLPRADEDSPDARTRLDVVQAELGAAGVGPTYSLFVARPTDDRTRWHGFDAVALRADTPAEDVLLFPQYGGTPFGSAEDDWDWQQGWWHPYSTFRAERGPAA
jgi:hypothetical protein